MWAHDMQLHVAAAIAAVTDAGAGLFYLLFLSTLQLYIFICRG